MPDPTPTTATIKPSQIVLASPCPLTSTFDHSEAEYAAALRAGALRRAVG